MTKDIVGVAGKEEFCFVQDLVAAFGLPQIFSLSR